jgi:hypothetical protein
MGYKILSVQDCVGQVTTSNCVSVIVTYSHQAAQYDYNIQSCMHITEPGDSRFPHLHANQLQHVCLIG